MAERLREESNRFLAEIEGWETLLRALDWRFLKDIDGGVQ